MKKATKGIAILAMLTILVVGGLLILGGGTKSIVGPGCPPLPASIYNGTYGTGSATAYVNGLAIYSCSAVVNSTSNLGENYSIDLQSPPSGSSGGTAVKGTPGRALMLVTQYNQQAISRANAINNGSEAWLKSSADGYCNYAQCQQELAIFTATDAWNMALKPGTPQVQPSTSSTTTTSSTAPYGQTTLPTTITVAPTTTTINPPPCIGSSCGGGIPLYAYVVIGVLVIVIIIALVFALKKKRRRK